MTSGPDDPQMSPDAAGNGSGDLIDAVVMLCRDLRDRGVSVTPSESIDAARTLGHVDLGDRDEVRLALRTVLVSRREDFEAFDAAFDAAWRLPGGMAAPIPMPHLRADVRRAPNQPPKKNAAVSLQNWMKPNDGTSADDPIKVRAASDRESLGERDFSVYSADDAEEFRRLARQIARRLALRKGRRWKVAHRGERFDLRRTVRASLRTGGDAIQIVRRTRKLRRTRLVALCDVSGSMELYARFLLQFLHALQNTFARVETFAFAT
ncbi:MAG: VWA domain-containing protein, partial [Gemmatimonadaceae bacterium]|nr:VWA domain-containing protein [Gemmatimonadaceae bacterium]